MCSFGQLGDGTTTDRYTPVQVRTSSAPAFLSGVAQVAAGETFTCVRTTAGGYRCFGDNSFSQFGDGTTTSSSFARATDLTSAGTLVFLAVSPRGFGHVTTSTGANTIMLFGSNWCVLNHLMSYKCACVRIYYHSSIAVDCVHQMRAVMRCDVM